MINIYIYIHTYIYIYIIHNIYIYVCITCYDLYSTSRSGIPNGSNPKDRGRRWDVVIY